MAYDALAQEEKISLDSAIPAPSTAERPSFNRATGCRIVTTAGNAPDPHRFAGRILYEKEIRARQAETCLHSLAYRDAGHEVDAGFIGGKIELLESFPSADRPSKHRIENRF